MVRVKLFEHIVLCLSCIGYASLPDIAILRARSLLFSFSAEFCLEFLLK